MKAIEFLKEWLQTNKVTPEEDAILIAFAEAYDKLTPDVVLPPDNNGQLA